MGQYYKIVNLDKREFLYPHDFGDGLKLREFGCSQHGSLEALSVLLASGNGRGGGDLNLSPRLTEEERGYVGRWAGDRIIIAGDYMDGGECVTLDTLRTYLENVELRRTFDFDELVTWPTLYSVAGVFFKNVGDVILRIVAISEGRRGHPWAAIDMHGSRDSTKWGVLPDKPPKEPVDKEAWEEYRKAASTQLESAFSEIEWRVKRKPDELNIIESGLKALLKTVREEKERAKATFPPILMKKVPRKKKTKVA